MRILFIHHGSYNGGAPLSMLYTMKGMRDAGYEPIAAIINTHKKLHDLYNDHGFRTIEVPWIPIFFTCVASEGKRYNPIMWKGVIDAWKKWKSAKILLLELLKKEEIDIVHLNSGSLSNPASALMEIDFPFVWHVREQGPNHKGRRFQFISDRLAKAENVIFLSKSEQRSWLGDSKHGHIIHNFVDISKLNFEFNIEKEKEKLGIQTKKIILYVGGIQKHKGIIPFLNALSLLEKKEREKLVCLMPHSSFDLTHPKGRLQKKVAKIILDNNLQEICRMLPFNPNIANYFAVCDVLVSPFTVPHFSRPIVEAGVFGKPSIATDIGPLKEQVVQGETGILIPPNNPIELSNAIIDLLKDDAKRTKMGNAAKDYMMENFEYHKQMKKILKIYKNLRV